MVFTIYLLAIQVLLQNRGDGMAGQQHETVRSLRQQNHIKHTCCNLYRQINFSINTKINYDFNNVIRSFDLCSFYFVFFTILINYLKTIKKVFV